MSKKSLESATVEPRPWPHMILDDVWRTGCDVILEQEFPEDGFHWFLQYQLARARGQKEQMEGHAIMTRTLLDMGSTEVERGLGPLSEIWDDLAHDLGTRETRDLLSDLTGVDVRNAPMRADFWRYMPGSSFPPHIDKPHKAVTILLYLGGDWPKDGGGELVLMADESDESEESVRLSPRTGCGALFSFHRAGWHGVRTVSRDHARERRGVQAWYRIPLDGT